MVESITLQQTILRAKVNSAAASQSLCWLGSYDIYGNALHVFGRPAGKSKWTSMLIMKSCFSATDSSFPLSNGSGLYIFCTLVFTSVISFILPTSECVHFFSFWYVGGNWKLEKRVLCPRAASEQAPIPRKCHCFIRRNRSFCNSAFVSSLY